MNAATADTPAIVEPLAGFTIAVTAGQQRGDLAASLERHGARIVSAPAFRLVPRVDDRALHAATLSCVERPPDVVVITTETGLNGWINAAEGWGLARQLRDRLTASYFVACGPKARGAARAAGLAVDWSPESGSYDEILEHLLGEEFPRGVAGTRVALQLHGDGQQGLCDVLRRSGASVIETPVCHWAPPADPTALRRLVDLVINHLVDAITFTSPAAVLSLMRIAGTDTDALLDGLRTGVLAACIGPVTAAPFRDEGVPVIAPSQARLGSLANTVVNELPRHARTLRIADSVVTLRGHAAVVDGTLRPMAPAPMAVLRALAEHPGQVLARSTLLRWLPRGADEHAVEMAVARLRAALGGPAYVQTVVKRGYRLRVD